MSGLPLAGPAATLALLRDAGFTVRADGRDLWVTPAARLTAAQAACVRRDKEGILHLLAMEAAVAEYDAGRDALDRVALLDARARDDDPPRYVAVNEAHWLAYAGALVALGARKAPEAAPGLPRRPRASRGPKLGFSEGAV